MKKYFSLFIAAVLGALTVSCGIVKEATRNNTEADKWKFGMDLDFLEQNADCVVIGENDSYVAISPSLQGRVMTSTLEGNEGYSLGWINRQLIVDGGSEANMAPLGGEDRLWVGPEGTEYSLFFKSGELFVSENWKIPAPISKEKWTLVSSSKYQAKLEKEQELLDFLMAMFTNMKGQKFDVLLNREISFIKKPDASKILGYEIPDSVKMVAFQSVNRITNKGDKTWSAQTGYLNLSVMSCFHANKSTYAFIPYKQGAAKELGDIIVDTYNETVGTDRLSIAPDFVRMRVDANKIGEITMNPKRTKGIIGSYDSERNILTIVTFVLPGNAKKYMPANLRRTNDIFDGDAISVFNNGPAHQGAFNALKFFETASYSPAMALAPQKSQLHVQRTFHFQGSEYDLGNISESLLGVTIKQLRPE